MQCNHCTSLQVCFQSCVKYSTLVVSDCNLTQINGINGPLSRFFVEVCVCLSWFFLHSLSYCINWRKKENYTLYVQSIYWWRSTLPFCAFCRPTQVYSIDATASFSLSRFQQIERQFETGSWFPSPLNLPYGSCGGQIWLNMKMCKCCWDPADNANLM